MTHLNFPRSTDTRPEMASAIRKDAAVPPPHPAEFRRRAVELARQRSKPIAELAKEPISESCLRNWGAQPEADENGSQARLTSAEKRSWPSCARISAGLNSREILKRTAAYSLVRMFSHTD